MIFESSFIFPVSSFRGHTAAICVWIEFAHLQARKIMSITTKNKVNKFLKTKRIDGELQGKFSFTTRWPLICGHNCEYLSSPQHSSCGTSWALLIYPNGVDESSEFVSVKLANMSEEEVYASYELSIKHQKGGKDRTWKDPEGIVLFSGRKEGDNAWGADEFMSLQALHSNDDFTVGDRITFEVSMDVYGRDYLKTETLSQAIQDTAEKGEIIKLADEEILELTKKLPVLRDSVAQKRQEDGLVRTRAPTAAKTSRHHS